ncbi:MAG: hypothetical protein IT472_09905 [Thermomonas sp.]|uniref:hypothetical protein n=1 Tax=Thermomonas sp. TaxID=1971895 RepID=UPI00260DB952|nr:hypothetical protein [Thermomonas sp.]MCC7097478.1 hypothetical protein [Thermomonas sp.]
MKPTNTESGAPNLKAISHQLQQHAATLGGHHDKCVKRIADLEAEAREIKARPLSREDYLATVKVSLRKHYEDAVSEMARLLKGHSHSRECTVEGHVREAAAPVRSAEGYMRIPFGRPLGGLPNAPVFHGQLLGIVAAGVASIAEQAVASIEPWPYSDTVPLADSLTRLDEIDAELIEARADLREVLAHIEAIQRPMVNPVLDDVRAKLAEAEAKIEASHQPLKSTAGAPHADADGSVGG